MTKYKTRKITLILFASLTFHFILLSTLSIISINTITLVNKTEIKFSNVIGKKLNLRTNRIESTNYTFAIEDYTSIV